MFKFLHIADVHLDTTFLCRRPELRDRLREALRRSFEAAVDCAIEEQVNALLIAGDLFDNDRLSWRTERSLVEQCRRLDAAGITTIYVSGNHDPGGNRYRAVAIPWPGRFRYLGAGEPVIVDVAGRDGELAGRVVGAGHASAREGTNLAARFPRADGPAPHVGLLHTMVSGATGHDAHERYAPCSLDDLRKPGYDYWALGHIHVRQQVCDVSNAYYPGNIQGRHARESGTKGGLLVKLQDGLAPQVAFRRFAPVEWENIRLDKLSDVSSLEGLVRILREALEPEEPDGHDDRAGARMLRVMLSGPSALYNRLGRDAIAELEEELLSALQRHEVLDVEIRLDAVTRPVDLSEFRGQPHLLGEVLSLLEAAEQDPEILAGLVPDQLAGLQDSEDGVRLIYARSLLDGLEREAGSRLLKEKR